MQPKKKKKIKKPTHLSVCFLLNDPVIFPTVSPFLPGCSGVRWGRLERGSVLRCLLRRLLVLEEVSLWPGQSSWVPKAASLAYSFVLSAGRGHPGMQPIPLCKPLPPWPLFCILRGSAGMARGSQEVNTVTGKELVEKH